MTPVSFIPPDLRRLGTLPASVLGLFRFNELEPFAGFASLVDWRLLGHLSRLVIERFFAGDPGEILLMPLSHRLPIEHLLLIGLGERSGFGRERFEAALARLFAATEALDRRGVALVLPGRPEGVADTARAIEWFLGLYERLGGDHPAVIIESPEAQKAMLPAVERWRLRQLLP